MSALFESGRIVDPILVLIVLELTGLLILRARLKRGPSALALTAHLAAGAFLLLALRGALVGAGWPWIALTLLCAFAAHIADQLALFRAGRT